MNRVVITGLGAITPLGNTVEEYWKGLISGKNGIGPITKFDKKDLNVHVAAEVKNFDVTKYMDKKMAKRMDLFSQYGVAAAVDALEDSNITKDTVDFERMGIILGTGIGGMNVLEQQIIKMHDRGPTRVSPFFIPMAIGNMVAGNLSLHIGSKGICTTVCTACASATNAIGEAFRQIKHGYADVILAGGTEATICESAISGFAALNALSSSENPETACRPFDKYRDGFVMGEGAGILVLENLDHALKRSAKIYGEIIGYGATSDAYHMTAPSVDGSGAGKAILDALEEGNIKPHEVDYINAHGTSTQANDVAEVKAIRYALKEESQYVLISSTKSMTGHLLGAAGAIEAIACVKAIQENIIPPSIHITQKDEDCDLTIVENKAIETNVSVALSNSLGFGGHNAVLCFKKWVG